MKLTVISAGLRDPSSTRLLADKLAQATATGLAETGTAVEITTVEVRTLAHDVVDMLLTGVQTPALAAARAAVQDADALIVATPTFSTSYSGLMKSFLDTLDPDSLTGVPVLLAATGGTARHSMVTETALRPLLTYLKAITVPTAVYASAEDWGHAGLDTRIEQAGTDLAQLARALPLQRRSDPFDVDSSEFTAFEGLLRP